MERHYCASVFVIYENKLLLMLNGKLEKWLQPGGHIEGLELPHVSARRECFEETGIEVEFDCDDKGNPKPLAVEHYSNNVGDMIDIQYSGTAKNIELRNEEGNPSGFYTEEEMISMGVDEEIINKFRILHKQHKNVPLRVRWNFVKNIE